MILKLRMTPIRSEFLKFQIKIKKFEFSKFENQTKLNKLEEPNRFKSIT